ncbi:MAG: nucleotide exchange factor GrpE [Candidatus Scalindua sp.]
MTEESKEKVIEKESNVETKEVAEDVAIEDGKESCQEKESDELMSALKDNNNLLQEIKGFIQDRLEYDDVKEKAIDKLNDELLFYRDNFVFQSQKGLFVDLMLLYDSLERMLNETGSNEVLSKERLIEMLEVFKEEFLEVLYRKDITPFDEHPEYLDFKLHKTIKTIPTDEEAENNKVDKIVKRGFLWNDKVLRPEEVIIKKYFKEKKEV